jgi:hypothetical protein
MSNSIIQSKNKIINPWLVTGFTDAEGCFSARIAKNKNNKFYIAPVFSFHMHIKDLEFMFQLREFFGLGSVRITKTKTSVQYQVTGINNLLIVLEHFKFFPLQSNKRHSLIIFSIILDILIKKEHLTDVIKTISYINTLNKPISEITLAKINNTIGAFTLLTLPPVIVNKNLDKLHPYWIVGFIMGEGSFTFAKSTYIHKKTNKTRVYFSMIMSISQLKTEVYLLRSIANHIGAGSLNFSDKYSVISLSINKNKTIQHLILPFFYKYPLLGNKKIQFDLWLKAVLLIIGEPKYSENRQKYLINIITKLSNYQSRSNKICFVS